MLKELAKKTVLKIKKNIENTSRFYLEEFLKKASESLDQGSRVLDAGSGDCRYKKFFNHVKYESADFCKINKSYVKPTYICDLSKIPVESKRYDMIICTQVFEHISEPKDVLRELFRVLKPGGELWLSASFSYEEHEVPYDFFRYTKFGLKHILSNAGFQIKSIEPLEGYYMKLAYELSIGFRNLPINSRSYGGGIRGGLFLPIIFFLKFIFLFSAILFSRLDRCCKNIQLSYCKNYCAVAKRPVDN